MERYTDLTVQQRQEVLDGLNARYWQLMDALAAVVAEKCVVIAVIQSHPEV